MTDKEFKLGCMVNNLITVIALQSDMSEEELWKWLKLEVGITKSDWRRVRSDLDAYSKKHYSPDAYKKAFKPLDV